MICPGGGSAQDLTTGFISHADTRCCGDNDQGREDTFHQHSAVSDNQGIVFTGNLLGGCSRGNQSMETGNGTAGNGDEQERPHGRGTYWSSLYCGSNDMHLTGKRGHKYTSYQQNHGHNQLVRVDEITGLKQGGYRQNGSNKGVGQKEQCPSTGRGNPGHGRQGDGKIYADNNGHVHGNDGQDRQTENTFSLLVNQVAKINGNGDFHPHRENRRRIFGKDNSHNQTENGDEYPKLHKYNNKKHQSGSRIDVFFCVIGNGLSLVAH